MNEISSTKKNGQRKTSGMKQERVKNEDKDKNSMKQRLGNS